MLSWFENWFVGNLELNLNLVSEEMEKGWFHSCPRTTPLLLSLIPLVRLFWKLRPLVIWSQNFFSTVFQIYKLEFQVSLLKKKSLLKCEEVVLNCKRRMRGSQSLYQPKERPKIEEVDEN